MPETPRGLPSQRREGSSPRFDRHIDGVGRRSKLAQPGRLRIRIAAADQPAQDTVGLAGGRTEGAGVQITDQPIIVDVRGDLLAGG
jgi:hypothetical protein